MPNKYTEKHNTPPAANTYTPADWLKGCSPTLAQAKTSNNKGEYFTALLLAREDFKIKPSLTALDIICDSCIGLKYVEGYKETVKQMQELNAPKGILCFKNALYNLYFLNNIKQYNDLLDEAQRHLQDLTDEMKADLFILKSLKTKNEKESIALLDKAFAYKKSISPQKLALIHYYKALAYTYLNKDESAYCQADLSVKAAPEEWQGYYARALSGSIIQNLTHLLNDCDFVLNHKDSDNMAKKQMASLKNIITEKLLHPKNAKLSVNDDVLKDITEKFFQAHSDFAHNFMGVNTFRQAEQVLCSKRLNKLLTDSIKNSLLCAKQYLKPILTEDVKADLQTLKNNMQTLAEKKFSALFKQTQELTCGLKDFMDEALWCAKGQLIIMHSIMQLSVADYLSANMPQLKHLQDDEKADAYIQKLRAAIKQINDMYKEFFKEFLYAFTMLAAKYNADISIQDKQ